MPVERSLRFGVWGLELLAPDAFAGTCNTLLWVMIKTDYPLTNHYLPLVSLQHIKLKKMCAVEKDQKPNLILSILKNKCPRCRRGNMFKEINPYKLKTFMVMNERCLVCSQPLDLEPGFYYGTNMVSYALAVLICVLTFVIWFITIGFSLKDSRLFWWMGINAFLLIALQPPLMRLSRAVWIVFFVPYSAKWKEGDIIEPERVNKEHAGNW